MNNPSAGGARAIETANEPCDPACGPAPVMRVTAGVFIRGRRFLMTRRAPGKRLAGKWEFPGGKIEPGETPEQCLRRELAEELCIPVTVQELLGVGVHDYGNGPFELMAYRVSGDTDRITLRDHDAMIWTDPSQRRDCDVAEADWFILDILESGGLGEE